MRVRGTATWSSTTATDCRHSELRHSDRVIMLPAMKWVDAIERVLEDANEDLHYGMIADRILDRQLVKTKTATPDIVVHAAVGQDIRRRKTKNEEPRFTLKDGMIGLAAWLGPDLSETQTAIGKMRENASRDLLKNLRSLGGDEFESYLEVLLIGMGYEVDVIGGSGDRGIDLIAENSDTLTPQRIGIQAKCLGSRRKVGHTVVSILRDALPSKKCQTGAVIATVEFTDTARATAKAQGQLEIHLIGPNELFDLAAEHGIGVSSTPAALLREDLGSVFPPHT